MERRKRKKSPTQFTMNAMMNLIKEGKSRKDVAKLYGYSESAVGRWAMEHGMRRNSRSKEEDVIVNPKLWNEEDLEVKPEQEEKPKPVDIKPRATRSRRKPLKTFSLFWGMVKFNY